MPRAHGHYKKTVIARACFSRVQSRILLKGSRVALSEKIRLAAVGDTHCTKSSAGTLRSFFAQANEAADILLLCGDLTDYGLPEEAHVLADELAHVSIPIIAVLGNHDYES